MSRLSQALVLLAVTSTGGCSSCVGDDEQPAADATDPEPDATFCEDAWGYAPAHFDPCDIPLPSEPLVLDIAGVYTFTTDSDFFFDPNGDQLLISDIVQSIAGEDTHLISVRSLVIGSETRLRVNGPLGLVIASWSTIDIDGTLDVSSSPGGPGAGARGGCALSLTIDGGNENENSSGGGGGGYGSAGNGGGSATENSPPLVIPGGTGGDAIEAPEEILGGCPGGRGGGVALGGAGGSGGGAVQMTAAGLITVAGTVHAGGEGGRGGQLGEVGGGGGGGAGGLIGFEAPDISLRGAAILSANGGGGGSGYGAGLSGVDAESGVAGDTAATGGNGAGGAGGDGGALGVESGGAGGNAPATDTSAAGGGGGGVGHLLIRSDSVTIDPAATISPAHRTISGSGT